MRFWTALLLVFAGVATSASTKSEDVEAYRELVKQDLRLASVGYRLASANSVFCKVRAQNAGWVLHDIAQYPDESAARAAFGFDQPVQVAAVVLGGPADRAGIEAGDNFVGMDDATIYWPAMPVGKTGYERMANFRQLVAERWGTGEGLAVKLSREGTVKEARLVAKPACASDFWVDTKAKLDAGADGERVRVTSGLLLFADTDNELAAAVAHELSHNLLGHRERLNAVKRRTSEILATEIEADRLSVWLMANAGYEPAAALRFAERYGRKTGLGIFSEGTHLRWKNRVKVMQAEIDLMQKTLKQDGLLPPPLLVGG
jgi:beta-barrel assembly-enhancing protease